MPTLKEIKGRIGSVQSTLKITSAMKLVSSAKLRKAQRAIEAMRPYEAALQRMLAMVSSTPSSSNMDVSEGRVLVIAIASNSSLCGSFNANALAKVKDLLEEYPGAEVWSVGRKMADAMRKAGYPSPRDWSSLSDHPSYSPVADMVQSILDSGAYAKVFIVYNHFVSTARQEVVVESLLDGMTPEAIPAAIDMDFIIEPSPQELLRVLLPKTQKLKLYAALLDSAAAEHAARTVAMQTATDNGENLLSELTLQYNKGRQQKITNEILDLAGGQTAE